MDSSSYLRQPSYVVSTVFFTHEHGRVGVAVTVCRMWLQMLIHVSMFFPRSMHVEFALWAVALTTVGSIWPRSLALPLTV